MSRIFGRLERRSGHWFGTDSTPWGGRRVTPEAALSLGPVFSALRHVYDFTSSLPVDCYRFGPGDQRLPSPIPAMLRKQEDPGRLGLNTWFGQAAFGLAAAGNAVGWVERFDGFGYPAEITWMKRQDWSFENGQWRVFGQPVASSRIFHIPWIVPPGETLGLSPIEHYASIVQAGLSAQEYADVRKGGGLPPAVLRNRKRALTGDESATIRDRAHRAFGSGKPFVTGNDWELDVTQIPPAHLKFVETLKLTASQIAGIYGIDPREIGGEANGSLTYSTDESRSLNRANDMRPYLERIERAVNRVLPNRQFIKLNVDATIRTDIKTRTEVIGAQLNDGRLNLNEARALEDRPPVPGGDFHNGPAPTSDPTNREGVQP